MARRLERLDALARMVETNWCAAWASLGAVDEQPRSYVDDTPSWLRVYTPTMPETLVNMIIRFAVPGPVDVGDVERALDPFRRYHLPTQWWLLRDDEPEGLRDALRVAGWQRWAGTPAMALDLRGWRPSYHSVGPDVTLGPVRDDTDARDALDVICQTFSVPPGAMSRWTIGNSAFHVYLARAGSRPVAALAVLYDGEVVGAYHVATLPGMRRRGIAGNLLIHALSDAIKHGAKWATLTATDEAQALYERLGYRTVGTIEQWMPGHRLMVALMYGGPTGGPATRWDVGEDIW